MRRPNEICHCCKKPMYLRPSDKKRLKTWHCSGKCYSDCDNLKINKICPQCGQGYKSSDKDRKFCSRTCSNRSRKGIKYGAGQENSNAHNQRNYREAISTRDGYHCKLCGISDWLNQPIVLQVDHVDGDNKNNDLENLRLLCPNCHSQTDTWGAKNIKRKA